VPDVAATDVAGVLQRGYRRGTASTDGWDPYVIFTRDKIVSFKGRAATFRIPGSALAAAQMMVSIHNAAGSAVLVDVTRIIVDLTSTATRIPGGRLPILRAYRVTVLPTGGSALGKNSLDSALSSDASVTLLQAASADRTGTTITATLPANAVIDEIHPSRVFSEANNERHDRALFLDGPPECTLRAGEGIVVALEDHASASALPITEWFTFVIEWTEYQRP